MKKYKFKKDLRIDVRSCDPQALLFMQDCILNDKSFNGQHGRIGHIDVIGTLMAFYDGWLIEIEEKSEAEKWIDETYSKDDLKNLSPYSLRRAHEAGQKIGAEKERERFGGLMGAVCILKVCCIREQLSSETEIIITEYEKLNKTD